MNKHLVSNNNLSFNFLHGSSEFLNLVISNISSCVLLLNREMMLQAFNDPMKTIFSNKKDEHLLYHRCGEAIGCAYTVEEMTECGNTSKCSSCELREAALLSYVNRDQIFKGRVRREFYKNENRKEMKQLQFSSRLFKFLKEDYVILIIDDVTNLTEQK